MVEGQIGKQRYILKLPATIRLSSVFYVNNPRPCSTTSLRHVVPISTPKTNDEEFDVSHISAVCTKLVTTRRGTCLLFMMHLNDDDISHLWHRLNDILRIVALQYFLETPQWCACSQTRAYTVFMHSHPTRIPESQ
jgi:hypothetical protein